MNVLREKSNIAYGEIISINEIEGFRIGNAENAEGGTGCTVVICEEGAVCGIDVEGGSPATRETDLLNPTKENEQVFGLLLSGGSAFGLDAAGGVMKYLEERNIGFDVGTLGCVPIVPAACIFDLVAGDPKCRPDAAMGYEACVNSEQNNPLMGNHGAGTGATIGKFLGAEKAMKGGLGSFAVQIGDLKVGAIAVVNCLGDIFDVDTGEQLAGVLDETGTRMGSTREALWKTVQKNREFYKENTVVSCVITNANLTKVQCSKMASVTHDGYAHAITPSHTSVDGDSVFFMAKGDVEVYPDALGDISAYIMSRAINDAVRKAESAYGFIASKDLKKHEQNCDY